MNEYESQQLPMDSGSLDTSGGMTRRSFLDRAGLATAAGMAAAYAPGFGAGPAFAQTTTAGAATRAGLGPDRFDYSPIVDRPVIKWPNNARVAFWVAPNI